MSRIKRLIRPDTQALSWTAAIPVFGLVAALLAGWAHESVAAPSAQIAKASTPIMDQASCARPVYPPQALEAGQTGTVELSFLINSGGKVIDSKLTKSSGHAALDQEVNRAISKCHFKPALAAGKPRQVWIPVRYVWTLN